MGYTLKKKEKEASMQTEGKKNVLYQAQSTYWLSAVSKV